MAGDWIKMRTNLWDDPRVMRLCDDTDQPEGMIIGGLYWLWSAADEHTEDGIMVGLTLRSIDRKTGIKGFGQALCDIGWLADHPEGVRLVNFDDHNGSSAKKRCQTAKRVANHRSDNAQETQSDDACNAPSVTGALAREDREKSITSISSARATRAVDKFPIHDDWQPSEQFPTRLLMAGIHPETYLTASALAEFVAFWSSRDSPQAMTQAQWDHKFFQQLQKNHQRNTGANHANGTADPRRLTAFERVQRANAAPVGAIDGEYQHV